MIATLTHYMESLDLRGVHWCAAFIGVLLCVSAMRVWGNGVLAGDDMFWLVNGLRRVALWLMALALLWDLSYADSHQGWQPWPPDLAAIFAVDIFLISGLLATYMRRRRERKTARLLTLA